MHADYPKRLIEVDLPIARISAHARREKSIRHGHISTLHIWWARRPLAACRAVICASLWPDPEDLTAWLYEAESGGAKGEYGPEIRAPRDCKPGEGVLIRPGRFLDEAREQMQRLAARFTDTKAGAEELTADLQNDLRGSDRVKRQAAEVEAKRRFREWQMFHDTPEWTPGTLQKELLTFIAWGAGWEQSTMPTFLETARALTQAAHEALGGERGTRPLVVDPFAGGGSIPLEALRVGADAFASDINPVAVLLNRVVLEYIPRYGKKLADEVRKWGLWVKEQADKELAEFYPKDPDGATPITYLWARTILSEAPGEDDVPVEVPLLRSMWLSKKAARRRALKWKRDASGRVVCQRVTVTQADGKELTVRRPILEIFESKRDSDVEEGTVSRGSATCPVTGYTTAVAGVRAQLKRRRGGARDARLLAVVTLRSDEPGRSYRLPSGGDEEVVARAGARLHACESEHHADLSLIPDEQFPPSGLRRIQVPNYGIAAVGDMFTSRQALAISSFAKHAKHAATNSEDNALGLAVRCVLGLLIDKQIDLGNSLNRWEPVAECPRQLFARQSVPIVWDFAEGVPIGESSGSWSVLLGTAVKIIDSHAGQWSEGQVALASALHHPLPDDASPLIFTDPPYYDSVVYAHTADVFYPWLRRLLGEELRELFGGDLCPKDEEVVVDPPHSSSPSNKDATYFEQKMAEALADARRVVHPAGLGAVVFAHQSTAGWEAMLKALLDAGWTVVSSWPIDTEMATRVLAQGRSVLASSVHLACRPRENPDGTVRKDDVGEWREVLAELPKRIHAWMPRLAEEGVVGADAIFACLGPALEIFSRYSRVEKASGEVVSLGEYLEQVWAAVSKEALSLLFADADATSLEPDARLTAMWLWTLGAGPVANGNGKAKGTKAQAEDEEDSWADKAKTSGYTLEFDAARKIAQGLGAHLDKLPNVVEVKGDKARLLSVAERTKHLFGKDTEPDQSKPRGRKKKTKQLSLFEELDEAEAASGSGWGDVKGPAPGTTVLDRVHQAMILFAASRGEALKRFLVEDGAGTDARFWKLAQSLSALYPTGTDEKRWVDGVLGRKKGLGL